MSALLLRARADARLRIRSWLVLALITGVLSGALAAAGAGAVRTWSVYDRFVAETNGADVFVSLPCEQADDERCREYVAGLGQLDSVAAVSLFQSSMVPVTDPDGTILNPGDSLCFSGAGELNVVASPEEGFDTAVNRIQLIDGKFPAPSDDSGVIVSKPFADRTGVNVGDRILMYLESEDICDEEPDWGDPTEVRVAGIGLMHGQVKPESGFYVEMIHLTPARSQQVRARTPWSGMATVDLNDGATTDELGADIEHARIPGSIALLGRDLAVDIENEYSADTTTLTLVAFIGGIAVVLVVGSSMIRQASMSASDARTLWALGWTRRDLTRLGLLEGSILGVLAAILCVVTAFVLSPLTPLGEARYVDPLGTYHLDLRVVGLAAVAAWLLVGVSYSMGLRRAAVRAARVEPPLRRRAWSDRLVAAIPGLPVTMSTGCRLAGSSGRERDVVPIRTGTTGITLGLVGVVGAMTFLSSVDHLVSTPRLVGWNWDAAVFLEDEDLEQVLADLRADPDVETAGYGTFWPPGEGVEGPEGVSIWPISFSTGPDAIRPTIITGRAPEGADEVAVGTGLAYDGDLVAGDTLELTAQDEEGNEVTASYEVVGTTVLPIGDGNIGSTVALTFDGISRIAPDADAQIVFADLVAGADWDEVAARVGVSDTMAQEELTGEDQINVLIGLDLDRSRQAPQLLMLLLGVMVVSVLAHLVVTTVTHRRHELAVLRALGCSGRQARATVAWLVTIVASSTLLLSIPIGLFLGRQLWVENATFLHLLPETAVPWVGLLLLIPVTLLVANVVALIAGRRISRLATVDNLRPE